MFFKELVTGSTYDKYFPDLQITKTTFPSTTACIKQQGYIKNIKQEQSIPILYGPNFMKGKE